MEKPPRSCRLYATVPFLTYNPNQFQSRKLRVSHVPFHWISTTSPTDDDREGMKESYPGMETWNRTQDACEHVYHPADSR
jgi:hypothetical protein